MALFSCEGDIFTTSSSFPNYCFYIPVINRVAQSCRDVGPSSFETLLTRNFCPKLGGSVHFPASIFKAVKVKGQTSLVSL